MALSFKLDVLLRGVLGRTLKGEEVQDQGALADDDGTSLTGVRSHGTHN